MEMKTQQELLAKAIALAAQGHQDQFDRGGQPYILHCLTVMHKVRSSDPVVKQIAVMHDLLEDTSTKLSDLISLGFHTRATDALHLLTHVKGVSYQAYIDGICTNKDAILVKLADLRHNSDLTRLKGLTDKDFERMQKYQKAYVQLKSALEKY